MVRLDTEIPWGEIHEMSGGTRWGLCRTRCLPIKIPSHLCDGVMAGTLFYRRPTSLICSVAGNEFREIEQHLCVFPLVNGRPDQYDGFVEIDHDSSCDRDDGFGSFYTKSRKYDVIHR